MRITKAIFAPEKFTGWHMLGVLVLFFGTIISVNMVLAFSAGSTWTGLIVKNTYVESQKFNERTQAYKQQAALGWQYDVSYEEGQLSVALRDSFANPVSDAVMVVDIGRPVQEGEDKILQMTETDGRYSVDAELAPGLWRVRMKVIGPLGEQWQRSLRFSIYTDGRLVPEGKA